MKHLAIYTPDEARTKWCPSCGPTVGNDGSRCIASACMAWRWFETHIPDPANPEGDLIKDGTTYGYCGLAGSPS